MKRSNIRTVFTTIIISFLFAQASILSQVSEADVYSKASSLKDPQQKIEALQNFIKEFPDSHNTLSARYNIFRTYVDLKSEEKAIEAAEDLINNSTGGTQISLYNTVAFTFAENKMALQNAKGYIDKALNAMEGGSPRSIRMFQDTKALVLYNLGYPDSALALEKEAIVGNEKNSDYLKSLSVFEFAAGQKEEALTTAAKSILYGNTEESIENFNKWINGFKKKKDERIKLRNEIADKVLKDYLKDNEKENKTAINSNAAVFMARMNFDLPKAGKWASDAVKSINKETSLDDIITYKTNLAIVYSNLNKNQEALKELTSVKEYVDPWNSDYWYTLGNLYERLKENDKALNAYVSGLIAFKPDKVLNAARDLVKRENKNEDIIDKEIDKQKDELKEFEPGKFEGKNSGGRVVLAELFTGAECPPCVGADLAFDKLSEYYPKNVFAVLEYHVHIPGPDPLTNPLTFRRYKYYGGNFGTPTVFFDGGNQIIGGGPDILKANRFKVYNYTIRKQLEEKPAVLIDGSAKVDGNAVKVNVNISQAEKSGNLTGKSLHIALAEKSVDYTGGNGVSKQLFAVRYLVDGAEGSPVDFQKESQSIEKTINLDEVENLIKTYLDDPTKDPSWRGGKPDWRARPETLNPHNLAIVAWVQDNSTKQILQAFYTNVNNTMGSK